MRDEIKLYNEAMNAFKAKADELFEFLENLSKDLSYKIWHNTVVFFDDGNPLYSYSLRKSGLELMFWNGQDFYEEGLRPIGLFKSAVIDFKLEDNLPIGKLEKLVLKAKSIQYDYKNIVKNKGILNRLK